jgi:hypothetical protein
MTEEELCSAVVEVEVEALGVVVGGSNTAAVDFVSSDTAIVLVLVLVVVGGSKTAVVDFVPADSVDTVILALVVPLNTPLTVTVLLDCTVKALTGTCTVGSPVSTISNARVEGATVRF